MLSGLQSFWWRAKTSEQCKISELPPNSQCAINILFIYKITEVKICMSLWEHHDVTFAENDTAAYMLYLGPHRKLILTASLPKLSQTYLKTVYIQKMEKKKFDKKYPKGPYCVTQLIRWFQRSTIVVIFAWGKFWAYVTKMFRMFSIFVINANMSLYLWHEKKSMWGKFSW